MQLSELSFASKKQYSDKEVLQGCYHKLWDERMATAWIIARILSLHPISKQYHNIHKVINIINSVNQLQRCFNRSLDLCIHYISIPDFFCILLLN